MHAWKAWCTCSTYPFQSPAAESFILQFNLSFALPVCLSNVYTRRVCSTRNKLQASERAHTTDLKLDGSARQKRRLRIVRISGWLTAAAASAADLPAATAATVLDYFCFQYTTIDSVASTSRSTSWIRWGKLHAFRGEEREIVTSKQIYDRGILAAIIAVDKVWLGLEYCGVHLDSI